MTSKKHKRGDIRSHDGKIFVSYKNLKKSDGTPYIYEEWLTPKSFNKCNKTQKLWRIKNREKIKNRMKKYNAMPKIKKKRTLYLSDKDVQKRIKLWQKKYFGRKDIKDRIAKYMRDRRKNDPIFIIKTRARHRIYMALNKINKRKSTRTIDLIGCSYEFLKKHIEKQFRDGMSWDKPNSFHIDHIKPLSSFDVSNPEELKKACHWKNLQPLTPLENKRKSSKCRNF